MYRGGAKMLFEWESLALVVSEVTPLHLVSAGVLLALTFAIFLIVRGIVHLGRDIAAHVKDDHATSIISRYWGKYRRAGLTKEMLGLLVTSIFAMAVVKFVFDILEAVFNAAAPRVSETHLIASLAPHVPVVGFAIVLFIALTNFIRLGLAVRVRARELGRKPLGMRAIVKLYIWPAFIAVSLIYAPEIAKWGAGGAAAALASADGGPVALIFQPLK